MRMRDQPALTTSPGTIWLVVGALVVLATGVALLPSIGNGPIWLVVGAPLLVLLLYLGMIVVRVAVAARPRRDRLLAVLMGAQCLVGLAATISLAAIVWSGVPPA